MKFLRVGSRAAATALSVTAVALLLAAPSEAARGKALRAVGFVEAVTLATPEVAARVTIKTGGGANQSFLLAAESKVFVEDIESPLSAVVVGDEAIIDYAIGTTAFTVVKLQAQRPRDEVYGLVTRVVKNEDSTVSVTIDSPFADPMVLKANDATEVRVEGKKGSIDLFAANQTDLDKLVKMYGGARYVRGTDQADTIVFQNARRLPFKGTVVSVSGNSYVLKYEGKEKDDEDSGKELTLVTVPGGSIVKLNGKQVSDMKDVHAGDTCLGLAVMTMEGEVVSTVATHAFFKWPKPVEFAGTIQSVSPVATEAAEGPSKLGTVAITTVKGETMMLTVYSDTKLKVAGKTVTFAELTPGVKCVGQARPRPMEEGTRFDVLRLIGKKPAPTPTEG